MRLSTYSQRELYAIERKIWRQINQRLAGGLAYGVDWPTLKLCYPQLASALRAVRDRRTFTERNAT